MSNVTPFLPVLESHEVEAVFSILVRLVRTDLGNQTDREKIAELQAAIDVRNANRPKFMTALEAYGFDIESTELWDNVRDALGGNRYMHAFHLAFPNDYPPADGQLFAPEPDDPERLLPTFEAVAEWPHDVRPLANSPMPKISDAILHYLRANVGRGVQVAEIKKYLIEAYGMETHEKTPGMTLYRLSKEHLVRRDGRDWYAVDAPDLSNPLLRSSDREETAADQ